MKILFQGDSITDSGRNYDDPSDLGPGYPKYVAEYLRDNYPNTQFEFFNRGISGDQTRSILKRWQRDTVDIDPDIITILVGINDTWHHVEDKEWVPAQTYENNYRAMLDAVKNNTHAKIVMMEQYLLPVEGMEGFHYDMEEKIRITRKLAREYADRYVPLDGLFASACLYGEPTFWTQEGVHPTDEGHKFIAEYCFDAISDIIEEASDEE